ncbi:hypothetical protein QAD02_015749 [Eretmocerus hayati]|uniref:Uncharacterized protein n=1 Tax=Eretmocerus hayati TaxID=131215 RepID=A0ACC2PC00_9HYME|nr:hypothetical protein QAD02_015749 [Eretmocerus hayati]
MSEIADAERECAKVSMCVFCNKDLMTKPTVILDKNMLNELATTSSYLKDWMHVTFNHHKFLKVHTVCEKNYRVKGIRAVLRIKNKELRNRQDMWNRFDVKKHCIFCAKMTNRSAKAKRSVGEIKEQSTLDEIKKHLKKLLETDRTNKYEYMNVRAHAIRPITEQSIKPLYHVDCVEAVGMPIALFD